MIKVLEIIGTLVVGYIVLTIIARLTMGSMVKGILNKVEKRYKDKEQ